MNKIAEDLLIFSRSKYRKSNIQTKNSPLPVESEQHSSLLIRLSDLNTLIQEKIYMIKKIANNQKKINISFDKGIRLKPEEESSILIKAKGQEITRIVSNLINNSIESINELGEITLSTRLYKKHLAISIFDSGCGIPSEVLEKIGNEAFSFNKQNGNGLGIYSAKKYLAEIGGSLEIQSTAEVGTMINLTLPVLNKKT